MITKFELLFVTQLNKKNHCNIFFNIEKQKTFYELFFYYIFSIFFYIFLNTHITEHPMYKLQ